MSETYDSATAQKTAPKERRDFFRISQDVYFDFKAVDSFTAETEAAEEQFEDAASLSLVNELKRLDKDSVQTLRLLTEKNRLLGDYLQTLSNKIDVIARHNLFTHENNVTQGKSKTRINLSEDGLAYLADRAIYKDSYLALRLIFMPNYVPVATFARVIRCEPVKDQFHIAVKFHRLTDADRQALSKQILKAQTASRKNRG